MLFYYVIAFVQCICHPCEALIWTEIVLYYFYCTLYYPNYYTKSWCRSGQISSQPATEGVMLRRVCSVQFGCYVACLFLFYIICPVYMIYVLLLS